MYIDNLSLNFSCTFLKHSVVALTLLYRRQIGVKVKVDGTGGHIECVWTEAIPALASFLISTQWCQWLSNLSTRIPALPHSLPARENLTLYSTSPKPRKSLLRPSRRRCCWLCCVCWTTSVPTVLTTRDIFERKHELSFDMINTKPFRPHQKLIEP